VTSAPNTNPGYGIRPPGHRLPDATRVGAVRLDVSDLERSLQFYQSILGLRVLRRDASSAALGPMEDETPLVRLHERRGARHVPRGGRLGLFHFAILLPDRAALGRLVVHLAEERVHIGASDHLVSEALYLSDPDGLGIEVYADRPRESWRSVDRELAMSTLPLDMDDLVRAAGGGRWSGAPAGTTMGHVHLHVGDLAGASAFYHDALGFDRVVWRYPGALFLSAGGYHHHLGVNTWAGPSASAPADDEARLIEWELLLPSSDDVDAARASLAGAEHAAAEQNDGSVIAHDPWGTALRLRAAPA
jgi:catechol 2,3-dioxygenase